MSYFPSHLTYIALFSQCEVKKKVEVLWGRLSAYSCVFLYRDFLLASLTLSKFIKMM